jgi:hypothetical protein
MQFTPQMNDGNTVFVFGSNLSGIHGAGAALEACEQWGARWETGIGIAGMSYAIPTKDWDINTMSLRHIQEHVGGFLQYARARPNLRFLVTAIGTGLAGYQHSDIAPMFKGAPPNCVMPDEWKEYL